MLSSQPVNGITGAWLRLRITQKGTASPTLSKIQFRMQYGIWLTQINEKYTCQLTIQDKIGNKLENATVTITDALGNSNILNTDENGQTASIDLIANITAFDKNASEADYNYSTTTKNPFTIKVEKNGYETYLEKINIDEKMEKTITIKPSMNYGFRR